MNKENLTKKQKLGLGALCVFVLMALSTNPIIHALFLLFLFIACPACLLLGLVSPQTLSPWLGSRATRKFICGSSVATFFGFLFLMIISANPTEQPVEAGSTVLENPSPNAELQRRVAQVEKEKAALQAELKKAKAIPKPVKQKLQPKLNKDTANSSRASSVKERLAILVREQLKKGVDIDRTRKVSVSTHEQGAYRVTVEFRAGGAINPKAYIEGDMMNVYKALYTSGIKISKVILKAYDESTVDKFGKPLTMLVYHTSLTKNAARKVEWSNYEFVEWGGIWNTVFLHSKYQPVTPETVTTRNNEQSSGGEKSGNSRKWWQTLDLNAQIKLHSNSVEINNLDSYTWTDVKITLNPGHYTYSMSSVNIDHSQPQTFDLSDFSNDQGERLDPDNIIIKRVQLTAQTPQGLGMYTGGVRR
jgi:hypothetical protein